MTSREVAEKIGPLLWEKFHSAWSVQNLIETITPDIELALTTAKADAQKDLAVKMMEAVKAKHNDLLDDYDDGIHDVVNALETVAHTEGIELK